MTWRTLGVVLAALLALTACSSPEEKAARAQLDEALALEQQNNLPAARTLLAELVKTYPGTDEAREALAVQQRIVQQLDAAQRELHKTLESLVLVFAGYQSMSGKPLTKLGDLDEGGYIFGSDYLAETVPADVDAYILLDGKGGFSLWLYRADYRMGVQRDNRRSSACAFAGDEQVARLLRDYRGEKLAANVTNLLTTRTAEN